MAAKFEIRSPKPGQYNWVLLSQGRTLAIGESYTRKVSAEKAIASMRQAVGSATVVDLTLPPAKTTAGRVARTAGRVLARAVVTSGQAVEQVEQTVAQAATGVTTAAKKTAKKAKAAATKPRAKKRKGKGKKSAR